MLSIAIDHGEILLWKIFEFHQIHAYLMDIIYATHRRVQKDFWLKCQLGRSNLKSLGPQILSSQKLEIR